MCSHQKSGLTTSSKAKFRSPSKNLLQQAVRGEVLFLTRDPFPVAGDPESGRHPFVYDVGDALMAEGCASEKIVMVVAPGGDGWGPHAEIALEVLDMLVSRHVGVLAIRSVDRFGGNPNVAHVLCETLGASGGVLWVDGRFIDPWPLRGNEAALSSLAAPASTR